MADSDIFEIIKKEKLNIVDVDTFEINKIFCKFYFKYMTLIKKKYPPRMKSTLIMK